MQNGIKSVLWKTKNIGSKVNTWKKKMIDLAEHRYKENLAFHRNVESWAKPGDCTKFVGTVHKLSGMPKFCLMFIIEIMHVFSLFMKISGKM